MQRAIHALRGLTRGHKAVILWLADALATPAAMLLVFFMLPAGLRSDAMLWPWVLGTAAASMALHWALRLPQVTLREFHAGSQLAQVVHAGGVGLTSLALAVPSGVTTAPIVHVLIGMLTFSLLAVMRVAMLRVVTALYLRDTGSTRVVIYGAGGTGRQLARALQTAGDIEVVGFLDDNTSLQRRSVAGLAVHAPAKLAELAKRFDLDRVCLAMPTVAQTRQAQIARRVAALGLEVQSVPSFSQLIAGDPIERRLRPVDPLRFLPRDEMDQTAAEVVDHYAGRVVMVTGAGGSIGSELCRQLLACRPAALVLLDVSEFALYTVHAELSGAAARAGIALVPRLGSVVDEARMARLLRAHGVEVVLHAAAYKHVPLVEENPGAGLRNNVMGTRAMARAAMACGVERFILVSTDKAVRPKGVMGASKRLAELVVQDLAVRTAGTIFAMVRFGNVLGSSGSVVPLFQEQILRGGPVTVTHPQVSRYFMTIPEAGRLVLTAGAMAQGGEVFVLDMGKPVPIAQLARQAIEASGHTVKDPETGLGDIAIAYTGLRPGEKLWEELSYEGNLIDTSHPKINCARERAWPELELAGFLRRIEALIEAGEADALHALLSERLEGFPAPEAAEARPATSAT